MDSKHGQHRSRLDRLRQAAFGDGLLERARATTLGLLGLTAAVGLAFVAVGLNQSWPLIPGSSIPSLSKPRQAVGEATVVAGAGRASGDAAPVVAKRGGSSDAGPRRDGGNGSVPPSRQDSPELVVSPSTPVQTGGSGGSGKVSPPKVTQPQGSPKSGSTSPPQVTTSPSSEPASTTPAPADATSPPSATVSTAPETSSTPAWSNGQGHAYGRSSGWGGGGDWGDDDRDWDGHGHGWGHH